MVPIIPQIMPAIRRKPSQKERCHKPILLVFDHRNVLVDLERTTAVSLLGKTVLVDQTIPSFCPFVTTGMRVPALLLDQAKI